MSGSLVDLPGLLPTVQPLSSTVIPLVNLGGAQGLTRKEGTGGTTVFSDALKPPITPSKGGPLPAQSRGQAPVSPVSPGGRWFSKLRSSGSAR